MFANEAADLYSLVIEENADNEHFTEQSRQRIQGQKAVAEELAKRCESGLGARRAEYAAHLAAEDLGNLVPGAWPRKEKSANEKMWDYIEWFNVRQLEKIDYPYEKVWYVYSESLLDPENCKLGTPPLIESFLRRNRPRNRPRPQQRTDNETSKGSTEVDMAVSSGKSATLSGPSTSHETSPGPRKRHRSLSWEDLRGSG